MEEVTKNILIIDDDQYSREAIAHLLGAEGYQVTCSETGAAGYQNACKLSPDVIILDLNLPDVDGKEVIGEVRRNHSLDFARILVITGRTDDEAREALCLGANAFLIKPIEFGSLLKTLPTLQQPTSDSSLKPNL